MKFYRTILFLLLISFNQGYGQYYDDFLGAGNDQGITVITSHDMGRSTGENTINGSGFDASMMEASRFLFQASFGGSMEEIDALASNLDFEAWIDEQFDQPVTNMLPKLWSVDQRARMLHAEEFPNDEYFGPFSVHFQYAWWENNFKAQDQLRQRIAYALSQILVISINSQLGDFGEGLASYYDILINNALGNYEDLLQQITVDPNKNLPNSSPLAKVSEWVVWMISRYGEAGPSHTVSMEATIIAPTIMTSIGPNRVSMRHTRRSLRANSPGMPSAVVWLTENSSPGNVRVSVRAPANG